MDGNYQLSEADVEAIQELIRIKSLVFYRNKIGRRDLENVGGQAMMRFLERLPKFDPDRSSILTFADRVVDSFLIDHWRYETAQKRGPERITRSLHRGRSVDRDSPFELSSFVDSTASRLTGPDPESAPDPGDFHLDLEAAMKRLAAPERELVELLGEGWSMEAIAEKREIRRESVFRQVKQVRRKLKALQIYL